MSDKKRESIPTVMYRAGEGGAVESRTFDHPADVPAKEGWVDSPAKVKPAKKAE